MLALFAGLILTLGTGLPAGLDAVFEYLVGITVVTLGAVALHQLGRYRSDYRCTGRISLVVGAFLVGLLHGTGASTSTQVVLLATTPPPARPPTPPGARGLRARARRHGPRDRRGVGVGPGRRPPRPVAPARARVVTGVAPVTSGALILTGHSDLVTPLVPEG